MSKFGVCMPRFYASVGGWKYELRTINSYPTNNEGKNPRQPKSSLEKVNVVTTRGRKSTHDPPNPKNKAGRAQGK